MVPYLIEYYAQVYKDLEDMTELVRTDGKASQFKLRGYFKEDVNTIDPKNAADYSAYMEKVCTPALATCSRSRCPAAPT
jgi:hypothetical protein